MKKIQNTRSKDFKDKIISELHSLLSLSKDIVERYKINTSDINLSEDVYSKLDHYSKLLTPTILSSANGDKLFEQHVKSIEYFYNKNRNNFIHSNSTDWLDSVDNERYIQYGEGSSNLKPSDAIYRIRISSIFRMALENKKFSNENIHNIDMDEEISKDAYRDRLYMLRLMRIFYYIIDTKDLEKLELIISDYEDDLQVPKDKRVTIKRKTQGNGSDIISEVTKRVRKCLDGSNLGINIPENLDFDQSKILGTMDYLLENDTAKGLIQTLGKSAKSFDQAKLDKITSSFTSPEGGMNENAIAKTISTLTDSFKRGDLNQMKNMITDIGIEIPSEVSNIMENSGSFDMNTIKDMMMGTSNKNPKS